MDLADFGKGDRGMGQLSGSELHPRLVFDLELRRRMFSSQRRIEVPAGDEQFWTWYAETVRFGEVVELVPLDEVPRYPGARGGIALWFSGGVESTYSLERLRHLQPVLLRIEDFPVFSGPDRKLGQIHFICAAIGASLGFSVTYLGVERDDLLLAKTRDAQRYVERSALFIEKWNKYQPEHPISSVCGDLQKEEIIDWLYQRGVRVTGTCDRLKSGRWCGDCYKCFEAFYFAKAVGINLGIRLTRRGFAQYYTNYRRYVDSGFTDNYNNSYHRFARLQMVYNLEFEPERDCAS